METAKFRWIGAGCISRVKGTLSRPKDRKTYSSFQIGDLVVSVNDFVYIRNFDSTSRVNCFVGRVLDLYEKDEIEKGEDGDHNRAVVQWYCRISDVAKKHYDLVSHYPVSQLPEMIRDCRPYHNDIDVETIFDLCKVVEMDPYLEKEDEFAEKDERMFVVRWKYDGKSLDAVKKSTTTKDDTKGKEDTSASRRGRKSKKDAVSEGASEGSSKKRRRTKDDSEDDQQNTENDSEPPEIDQGDAFDDTKFKKFTSIGHWRVKKPRTAIPANFNTAGTPQKLLTFESKKVCSPRSLVLQMRLEKLTPEMIGLLQGSPSKLVDHAVSDSIVGSTPKRLSQSATKSIGVEDSQALPSHKSSTSVTFTNNDWRSAGEGNDHKSSCSTHTQKNKIPSMYKYKNESSDDPSCESIYQIFSSNVDSSGEEVDPGNWRSPRKSRKVFATSSGLQSGGKALVTGSSRANNTESYIRDNCSSSALDRAKQEDSGDDDKITLKSSKTTPNSTAYAVSTPKSCKFSPRHRGDPAKKKLLMDEDEGCRKKDNPTGSENGGDDVIEATEVENVDFVGGTGSFSSLPRPTRRNARKQVLEKREECKSPIISPTTGSSPAKKKVISARKKTHAKRNLVESDNDENAVVSNAREEVKSSPSGLSSQKKLPRNVSARKATLTGKQNLIESESGKGGRDAKKSGRNVAVVNRSSRSSRATVKKRSNRNTNAESPEASSDDEPAPPTTPTIRSTQARQIKEMSRGTPKRLLSDEEVRITKKVTPIRLAVKYSDDDDDSDFRPERKMPVRTRNKRVNDLSSTSDSSVQEISDNDEKDIRRSARTRLVLSVRRITLRRDTKSNSANALEVEHRGARARKKLSMGGEKCGTEHDQIIDIENLSDGNDDIFETTEVNNINVEGSDEAVSVNFRELNRKSLKVVLEKREIAESLNTSKKNGNYFDKNKLVSSNNGHFADSDSDELYTEKKYKNSPDTMSSRKKLPRSQSASKRGCIAGGDFGIELTSKQVTANGCEPDSKKRSQRNGLSGKTTVEMDSEEDVDGDDARVVSTSKRKLQLRDQKIKPLSRKCEPSSDAISSDRCEIVVFNEKADRKRGPGKSVRNVKNGRNVAPLPKNASSQVLDSGHSKGKRNRGVVTTESSEMGSDNEAELRASRPKSVASAAKRVIEDKPTRASPRSALHRKVNTPKRQLPERSVRSAKKVTPIKLSVKYSDNDSDSDFDPKLKKPLRYRDERNAFSDSGSSDSVDSALDKQELSASDSVTSSDETFEPEPTSKKRPKKNSVASASAIPLKKTKKAKRDATPHLPKRHLVPATPALNTLAEVRARLHAAAIPDSLPCRDRQFEEIYSFVEGKIQQRAGGCMYISGVPGTGKTATVNEVLRKLKENSETGEISKFISIKLNGMKMTEPQQAYVQLYEGLTGKKATATHARELLEKSFDKNTNSKAVVLLADELDLMLNRKQDVLYNFFDWPNRPRSRLVVLAIANTMDLPERIMKNRVASRAGLTRMTFQPYTFKQLQEILSDRMGSEGMFHPDALQLVARKVAALSGDARRALGICRRATEIVARTPKSPSKGRGIVGMVHVKEAIEEIFDNPKIKAMRNASQQERTFLRAVVSEFERVGVEEAVFSDVYKQHNNICRLEGYYTPSISEAMAISSRLGSCKLLILEQGRTDIRQKVRLNMSVDDVLYALNECE